MQLLPVEVKDSLLEQPGQGVGVLRTDPRRSPLDEMMQACRAYLDRTHQRITLQYVLIASVNDALEQARRLVHRISGWLSHGSLIPLHPIPGSDCQRPKSGTAERFEGIFKRPRVPVSVREERGIEIAAACGQRLGRAQGQGQPTISHLPRAALL